MSKEADATLDDDAQAAVDALQAVVDDALAANQAITDGVRRLQ